MHGRSPINEFVPSFCNGNMKNKNHRFVKVSSRDDKHMMWHSNPCYRSAALVQTVPPMGHTEGL